VLVQRKVNKSSPPPLLEENKGVEAIGAMRWASTFSDQPNELHTSETKTSDDGRTSYLYSNIGKNIPAIVTVWFQCHRQR
jgi:hypothetical protein